MTTWIKLACCLMAASTVAALSFVAARAQQPAGGPVRYTSNDELMRPSDYREWVFLSAGLGMTYSPPTATPSTRPPSFTNVFVNPTSYRRFMDTGVWPEQTMFILEIRASATEGSINQGGHYQADIRAVEAAVKDTAKYPEGWAYFDFGATNDRVKPLPTTASCYGCHKANAAVEHSFVQFYPSLMEVARRFGTVNRSYDPTKPPLHK